MTDSGSERAFTKIAQAMKANTNVGVALRIEPPLALPRAKKRISGISSTTLVSFTITAESNASGPIIDAVAITCPTSCTAAPIHAPAVASLRPITEAKIGITNTESVPHKVTIATAYETSRSSLFLVDEIAAIAVAPQIAKPPAISVPSESVMPNL